MSFRRIKYAVEGSVARITLNEPERLNVLGMGPQSNREEVLAAFIDADQDDRVGSILVDAAGRAFCAGGDLSGPRRETPLQDLNFFESAEVFHRKMRGTRKPIIAAVHGFCLGAGLSFIAQCDIVIAADDAEFGLPEGRMGLGGVFPLFNIVGPAWAKFLIMTGERINARRAAEIGLVLTVLPRGELAERAGELARRIAMMPKEGVALNKASINRVADVSGNDAAREAGVAMEPLIASAARTARAADGRMFRTIIAEEGLKGMIAARDGAYGSSWLRDDD